MKPGRNRGRLAGIVAASGVTAVCGASAPAVSSPAVSSPATLAPACARLPYPRTPAAGTSRKRQPGPASLPGGVVMTTSPRSAMDMAPVPGGFEGVAAWSSSSAVAVGNTGPSMHSRPLVALWNGAAWKTLGNRALPPSSWLNGVAVFPGGAWAVGKYGNIEHKQLGKAFIVRVTGATVRKVPIPPMVYGSGLDDVAATSATDAWAVGWTLSGHLILHWNGTAWTRVQLPATVTRDVGQVDGVSATSATDVWFVSLSRILHWNGRRWDV